MSKKVFDQIAEGLQEALAVARGEMMQLIKIEKNFTSILCGTVEDKKDEHNNDVYVAHNKIDGDEFTFYDKGTAEHWLKLCGMNRG